MSEIEYRSNVAGILRNAPGQILVCERLQIEGAWQFPQGGVDEGESLEQALKRELWEEIGVIPEDYRIVETRGPYRYLFGDGRRKRGFPGKLAQKIMLLLPVKSLFLPPIAEKIAIRPALQDDPVVAGNNADFLPQFAPQRLFQ